MRLPFTVFDRVAGRSLGDSIEVPGKEGGVNQDRLRAPELAAQRRRLPDLIGKLCQAEHEVVRLLSYGFQPLCNGASLAQRTFDQIADLKGLLSRLRVGLHQ